MKEFKESGRRLILVTGQRELPHLKKPFPELAIFDRVVAENGDR
jgi:hydroxymethylpyrimidine pyrophosphatase-like HAD family hydrolase